MRAWHFVVWHFVVECQARVEQAGRDWWLARLAVCLLLVVALL
jgi:hypothetical protein